MDTEPAPEVVLGDALAESLRDAYERPPRHHHSFDHARHVARVAAELGGDRACLLAAWAHDVVYDATSDDNEAASARWLADRLPGDPDLAEACRLIELTASHRPEPDDEQGMILCDADLSILGADADRYGAYRRAVRREYAHLDDVEWLLGRARVMRDLLDRPRLFHTQQGWVRWEAQARINVASELVSLSTQASAVARRDGHGADPVEPAVTSREAQDADPPAVVNADDAAPPR